MAMFRSRGTDCTGLASIKISPEVGESRPAISRSSVDFPHPDGPTTVTTSWSSTFRETASRALRPPGNSFDRLSTRIEAMKLY